MFSHDSDQEDNLIKTHIHNIHYRSPNKVGGSEPIFFNLEEMFGGPVTFEGSSNNSVFILSY